MSEHQTASRRRRPWADRDDVRLLSDEPITDAAHDYFGFAAFATALAEIIDNESTDTPLTIALSAPWGAGKTSVARMIQSFLGRWVNERDGDRPRIICWFNAWEHDDAPHLGAALSAKVARTASSRRRLWRRLLQPLPRAMLGPQERLRRAVTLGLGTTAVAAALTLVSSTRHAAEEILHLKTALVGGLGWLGLILVGALVWRGVFAAARDAARFVDDPKSEAARGSMTQVKGQLGQLLHSATRGGRMVIFVDDLERCRPERAVEIFEVAGQLLAHEGVVTVLLADMHAISDAAQTAYSANSRNTDDLGRRYLEKLVQLELALPPPAETDMQRLLRGDKPLASKNEGTEHVANVTARSSWLIHLGENLVLLPKYIVGLVATVGILAGLAILGTKGSVNLLGITTSSARAFSTTGQVALLLLTAPIAVATLGSFVMSTWRVLQRRQRRKVEKYVEFELRRNIRTVLRTEGGSRLESYAEKVAESIRTVRSPEIERVEQFIEQYPPRFPRGAKRMLNHARLLTKIARERKMFGGTPELTPEHLGKWIVLCERWPEIAKKVGTQASAEDHRLRFEDWMNDNAGADWRHREPDLSRLLDAQPHLADVIDRLVYFQPASETADDRSTGTNETASIPSG